MRKKLIFLARLEGKNDTIIMQQVTQLDLFIQNTIFTCEVLRVLNKGNHKYFYDEIMQNRYILKLLLEYFR